MTDNYMIDGDNGTSPASPYYKDKEKTFQYYTMIDRSSEVLFSTTFSYFSGSYFTFTSKDINITYCGSLIQQDFGERISNHGFLVWDVETLTCTEHNINTDYGYYVFRIDSLDDIENEREYLTNL